MKKVDTHTFIGMQRDTSISKQKAEFLWDAHNIRLTAREGDTLMSVTTEKGTKKACYKGKEGAVSLQGSYVGHCVIGNYLTVFTHKDNIGDYIYRLYKEEDGLFSYTCLTGEEEDGSPKSLNLGLSPDYPLQTLGVYENIYIQKVYWTDGVNQPRVINIVKDKLVNTGNNGTNEKETKKVVYDKYSFDFVPKTALNDYITVKKVADSSGSFSAGVMQYYISYYYKYGQETNLTCAS